MNQAPIADVLAHMTANDILTIIVIAIIVGVIFTSFCIAKVIEK